jgi:hypothetical protein
LNQKPEIKNSEPKKQISFTKEVIRPKIGKIEPKIKPILPAIPQVPFPVAISPTSASPKPTPKQAHTLTARDAELIEFCAQMKFASIPQMYERFFGKTLNGQPSKSDWYARERITALTESGFLKSNESFTRVNRYYTATAKGYQAAQEVMPFRELTKPAGGFDLRTFVHDRELIEMRLEMERDGQIQTWLSDRKLRMGKAQDFRLSSEFIPDAIVKNTDGTYHAIELEIAYKSRERYREKVQFFLKLIREQDATLPSIVKVKYVCVKDSVFKMLKDETSAYGEIFDVSMRTAPPELEGGK